MDNFELLEQELSKYIVKIDDYAKTKSIGKGGYGKVDIAIDQKTGKKVAIKELFLTKLEGRQLKLYCRETRILAKCNSMFLLHLNGFSTTHPYIIVTDYIENGSLFDALHHKNGAPQLTPTNKTIIATGIAHGMMCLHKMGIMHRDLKSLNILLDQNLYPKICDFGISRFKNEDTVQTNQIGTPHWMAPELFESKEYNYKVDVHAFAIILWELLTEQTPFRGKNAMQIMTEVTRLGERPFIPKGTPTPLSDLMKLCWYQTPNERPNFQQIYKLFKEKKIMFAGTDEEAFSKFIQIIEIEEENSKREKLPDILEKVDHSEETIDDLIELIRKFKRETFDITLNNIVTRITPDKYQSFFTKVQNVLLKNPPFTVISKVIDACAQICAKDTKAVHEFVSADILQHIPLGEPDIFISFSLLCEYVIPLYPNILSVDQLRLIIGRNPLFMSKVVQLISSILLSDKGAKDKNEIINLLFQSIPTIIEKQDSGKSIKYLSNIFTTLNGSYLERYKDILSQLLKSGDIRRVNALYNCLHNTDDISPSEDLLIKHLENPDTMKAALLYLRETNSTLLSNNVVTMLFNLCINKYSAILAIANCCDNPETAKNVFQKLDLLISDKFDAIGAIHILTVLSERHGYAHQILQTKGIDQLFVRVLKDRRLQSISTIIQLIANSNVDNSIAVNLESNNFIKELINYATNEESQASQYAVVTCLDLLAGFNYTEDFKLAKSLSRTINDDNKVQLIYSSFLSKMPEGF
ncbi:TKL family protein kinase [Trichomonas vaginalis G3]|uniref:TKL family protein kinase n=1 Tax=Trichomonas vaginalis (strain ATCC PRA-98 / G3) TaxID=412133 RepID=A2DFT3_TRIV3|nr:protein kinase protein [Trichomonas vaginalis G3]EAY20786.1 TKL family protein kinase [Trichomonas vaginalis G3]KAI5529428.1 protein kinase protein [Trichomonas vaginalis G3]|eukprot:XP_001581772.1 TKL family protein kinase [Trichomonas vaginalis G3]